MNDGQRIKELQYLLMAAAMALLLGKPAHARRALRKANVRLATLMVRVDKQIAPAKLGRAR